ncbi:MAG: DegV family protein [Bacillota bacterium]
MAKIKIITDSCSDLPKEVLDKYDISMLSTPVQIEGANYLDRETLSTSDFYQHLEDGALPTTSQINPVRFEEAFKQELERDKQVLAICFSSELSGIFQSALLAKRNIDSQDIRVVDSRSASVGFGLTVVRAAQAASEDRNMEEVIDITVNSAAYMEHIFAVGNLDMLKKGGRISGGKALIANVLNIKPILHFEDGKIVPLDKVRGEKRMLKYLVDIMEDIGKNPGEEMIGLNHSARPELVEQMKAKISRKFGTEQYLVGEIGAAVGSHVGKGTVSVFFTGKNKVAEPQVF